MAPGADPDQIRLAYRGASAVKLNDSGRLDIETPVGGFTEDRPYVYQDIGGQRVVVESAYDLKDGVYGFRLGNYDRSRPLVLDPVVLVYAGYIGGSYIDEAVSIAVDGNGNAYVTGYTYTNAPGFPVKVGPDKTTNGQWDVFVAKVNSAGTALVYAGYIGGNLTDIPEDIAVQQRKCIRDWIHPLR